MEGLGGLLGLEQGDVLDVYVVVAHALTGLEIVQAEGLEQAVVVVVGTQVDNEVLPVGGVLVVGTDRGGLGQLGFVGGEEELGLGVGALGAAELDEDVLVLVALDEGIGEVDELVGVAGIGGGLEAEEGFPILGDEGFGGLVRAAYVGDILLFTEVQKTGHVGGVVDALGGGGLGGDAVQLLGLGGVADTDGVGGVRQVGAVHVGALTLMGGIRPHADARLGTATLGRRGILHVVQNQQVLARGKGGLVKGKAQIRAVREVLEGQLRQGGGQKGGIVVCVKGEEGHGHRSRVVAEAGDIGGDGRGGGGEDELHGDDVGIRGGVEARALARDGDVAAGEGGGLAGGIAESGRCRGESQREMGKAHAQQDHREAKTENFFEDGVFHGERSFQIVGIL